MTRKSKAEKIISIEDQIKELQEKKNKMQNDLYNSIGKTLVNEWGNSDEKKIINVIKTLKSEAAIILDEKFEE